MAGRFVIQQFMVRFSGLLRRYRWAVFTAWLLLLAPSIWLSLTQSGHLTGGGFEVADSQSYHVQLQLEDHFPNEGASPLALVAAPRADATFEDMNEAVALLERKAAEVEDVTVTPNNQQPPPQPDRPYVVPLQLDFDNTGAVDVAKQLREKIGVNGEEAGEIPNGKVRLYVIGQGALGAAATQATKTDIAQAERWNLPIILIVLLAVFGSLAAAAMPLVLGICTVAVTMGLVYLLSMFTTMSVFVTSTVSMFGIALAIDYSLFILMRYREELRTGREPQQAVDSAMATSGLAVVLSGLTVIASVTAIYVIDTPVLDSMATGAILAVAVAVLTSTTLTPAVLATFGKAAARRSLLLHWSRRPETTTSRFWTRWTGWVMHRPWLSALLATLFLLTLAAPAFSMVLGNSMQRQFEPAHEIRGGVSAAAEALGPGALGPVRVLIQFDGDQPANSPDHAAALEAARTEMEQAPNIQSVTAPAFAADQRSALLSAVLTVDPEDFKARETVDWMRANIPPTPGLEGARVDVGGPTALIKDFDDRVAATQPLVFVCVASIAFIMLLISVRSVFLALKGVVMTILSVAAAYGSLVIVFQWGWLRELGFDPISSLDSTIPPLVLAMTFGLSMDYEIFLLSRIRERFLQTGDTRDAVAHGVSTSARTITSAALIMIAVFIGFAFAGMPLVAQLGVACAVAIAVDATVVRLVLVPALMAMMVQWNWWLPAKLGRVLPSVDFEKPLPKLDLDDVVVIPDDISALVASNSELRDALRSAARLKDLAPDAVTVADPLAFSGCSRVTDMLPRRMRGGDGAAVRVNTGRVPKTDRIPTDATRPVRTTGSSAVTTRPSPKVITPVHPVTMWRERLSVALDALEAEADAVSPPVERLIPVETTNVQLPTGDRLQIPTGAETLRLASYLIMCRNSERDYAEFADLVSSMDAKTVATVLAGMDRYYCGEQPKRHWVASQLVRRLADPHPADRQNGYPSQPEADADWAKVRQSCLSVAVAMLEEAR